MRRTVSGALVMGVCSILLPSIAIARPQYNQAFIALYSVKADSNLGKAKCQICHVGQDKKVRNAYGMALAQAIGKQNATQQEATDALKKVEKMLSADKKTPYVVLIKADKLPAGAPEAK